MSVASAAAIRERRKIAALESLGGRCVRCGSAEDLQFDHVDPTTKSFGIASRLNFSQERIDAELAKCQLLCGDCHRAKSAVEHSARMKGRDSYVRTDEHRAGQSASHMGHAVSEETKIKISESLKRKASQK